jgi:hypothetical protein
MGEPEGFGRAFFSKRCWWKCEQRKAKANNDKTPWSTRAPGRFQGCESLRSQKISSVCASHARFSPGAHSECGASIQKPFIENLAEALHAQYRAHSSEAGEGMLCLPHPIAHAKPLSCF